MTVPCDFIKCSLVWSPGPSFPFDNGDVYIDIGSFYKFKPLLHYLTDSLWSPHIKFLYIMNYIANCVFNSTTLNYLNKRTES
jgi:hypothetical protein